MANIARHRPDCSCWLGKCSGVWYPNFMVLALGSWFECRAGHARWNYFSMTGNHFKYYHTSYERSSANGITNNFVGLRTPSFIAGKRLIFLHFVGSFGCFRAIFPLPTLRNSSFNLLCFLMPSSNQSTGCFQTSFHLRLGFHEGLFP